MNERVRHLAAVRERIQFIGAVWQSLAVYFAISPFAHLPPS